MSQSRENRNHVRVARERVQARKAKLLAWLNDNGAMPEEARGMVNRLLSAHAQFIRAHDSEDTTP